MAEHADLLIRGGRLAQGGSPTDVATADGVITAIGTDLDVDADGVVDLRGARLAPGFIDLQVNGAFGWDITADPETMWAIGERLRDHGVTAFLPTLVSTDLEQITVARQVVLAGPPAGYLGATVLGLHIEGPFLSPERHGAHDPTKLRLPSPELVAGWSPATGVRLVTLAPELPGALDTIAALAAFGVVVSAGHSSATFDEAVAGFDHGVRMVTHLFNAMSGVGHRDPGLAAAAMADHRVTVGLILDLVHVQRGAVRAAWSAVGPDRLLLVTDIAAIAGAESISGVLGNQELISGDDGVPRLASGVLAGSVLTLDAAVRNHVDAIGAGLDAAIASVTTVPARLMGIDRTITPGAPADFTIIDDELSVVGTVVGGHLSVVSP